MCPKLVQVAQLVRASDYAMLFAFVMLDGDIQPSVGSVNVDLGDMQCGACSGDGLWISVSLS